MTEPREAGPGAEPGAPAPAVGEVVPAVFPGADRVFWKHLSSEFFHPQTVLFHGTNTFQFPGPN